MPYAAFRRQPVAPAARSQGLVKSFPAPIRGWTPADPLALTKPGGAAVLDNFFPTQTGIRPRGGRAKVATIGTGAVMSLFHYVAGSTVTRFAADAGAVYDITTPADVNTAPAAAVSGRTSGRYSTALFTTAGGTFLIAVNGTDNLLRYDGTTWTAVDAATSTAPIADSDKLSAVWVYRDQLFFVEGGTLIAHSLPPGTVGGTLVDIALGGIFQRGGSLLFGGTWSLDAGDGIDDKCVFVTDQGEMAVFEGADPSGATQADWNLVGRYDISEPLGLNVTMRAGGDLLILTRDGIVPVSAAVTKDIGALSLAAVSRNIEPEWRKAALTRSGRSWSVVKWASHSMAVVAAPAPTDADLQFVFVVNIETGAWCRYTNWDAAVLDVAGDKLYFGDRHGVIWEGETTGADGSDTIECAAVWQADHFGAVGALKTITAARGTFLAGRQFTPKISVSINYRTDLPSAPDVAEVSGEGWDISVWDSSTWDAGTAPAQLTSNWTSIGRSGFAVSPQLQISSNSSIALDAELVMIDMIYERGGVLV